MPSDTKAERAKRKVASNGKSKTSSHTMGGKKLTETKAGKKRKKKRAQMKREFT